MAQHLAPQVREFVIGASAKPRTVSVSFIDVLESGELLTGTPTVTEQTTTALTLGSKAVNTTTLTIDGVSNVAGQAVTFTVDGTNAVADTTYNILIYCGTNSTPAQVLPGKVRMRAVSA